MQLRTQPTSHNSLIAVPLDYQHAPSFLPVSSLSLPYLCRVLEEPCILSYSFSLNGDKSVTVFATRSFKISCVSTSGPEVRLHLLRKNFVRPCPILTQQKKRIHIDNEICFNCGTLTILCCSIIQLN